MDRRQLLRSALRQGSSLAIIPFLGRYAAAQSDQPISFRLFIHNGEREPTSYQISSRTGVSFLAAMRQVEAAYAIDLQLETHQDKSWRNTETSLPITHTALVGAVGIASYSLQRLARQSQPIGLRELYLARSGGVKLAVDAKNRPYLAELEPEEWLRDSFAIQIDYTNGQRRRALASIGNKISNERIYIPPHLRKRRALVRRYSNLPIPSTYLALTFQTEGEFRRS